MHPQQFKSLYRFLTHEDELFVYASSLSFYTLFAFVPLLLIIYSILAFVPEFRIEFEAIKELMLANILPTHSEMVAEFLDPLLSNRSKVGALGVFYVLLTSILFFRNYESITAKVFETNVRSFLPSLVLYWVSFLLSSLLFVGSFYAVLKFRGFWSEYIMGTWGLRLFSFLFAWAIFVLLFKISANKKLSFKALLNASLFSALCWSVAKWIFVYYVTYNRSYSTIYGSVSFVLFVMLWIYISWLIVLLGMRICEGMAKNHEDQLLKRSI